uniref:CASP-like protein n=1 Tax=Nelumbo nucifera TaxID=4432 RepID=A0A822ZG60_NELNU|nr:TPA_asm: hypothetical protein HUJ06_001803 [Nelumbo nucifera]
MPLHENGEKQESGSKPSTPEKRQCWVVLVLRVLALCATVSATVVMALNKETKTIVLATIGTTPIKATLNAKFQYTKAFVFFVIAYGIGSIHNLLVLVATLFPHKFDFKGLRLLLITITDMLQQVLQLQWRSWG